MFPRQLMLFFTVAAFALLLSEVNRRTELMAQPESLPSSPQPYDPDAASKAILGNVVNLLSSAQEIDGSEFAKHPAKYICKLPGGQIYFETATLNIDDDGTAEGSPLNWAAHPIRANHIDTSHQEQTSYGSSLPHIGKSDFFSAFNEPYIVLPGNHSLWFRNQGLQKGDGAVVIKGNKKIVAVFADVGPNNEIGEMSVKAHQEFGFDTFEDGFRPRLSADGKPMQDPQTGKLLRDPATVTVNRAQTGPFIIIVFPNTSAGNSFNSVESSLRAKIDAAFTELAGSSNATPPK
jgi:hypothetical protein